jgi:putative nucleotidyltransferase with HDIG domain
MEKPVKGSLVKALTDYFGQDYRRITHALEVMKHAERLAGARPEADPDVVLAAALLHDIGIKLSEQELGYNNGKTQEHYGPPEAEKILTALGWPPEKITRVSQIVGNHHSKPRYDYPERAILVEADRIGNGEEGGH